MSSYTASEVSIRTKALKARRAWCNSPFSRNALCKAAIDTTGFATCIRYDTFVRSKMNLWLRKLRTLAGVVGCKLGKFGVQALSILSILEGECGPTGERCRGGACYRRLERDAGDEGDKDGLSFKRHDTVYRIKIRLCRREKVEE